MKRIVIGAAMIGVACAGIVLAGSPYASTAVVPVYTAVHGHAQTNDGLTAAIVKLTASVDKLTATLEAIEKGPPTAPPAAEPSGLALAKSACLACHGPTTAEAKGFGFQLFADDNGAALAPLNNRDRQRAANRISDGSMPPPKHPVKLTDAERQALTDYFKQ